MHVHEYTLGRQVENITRVQYLEHAPNTQSSANFTRLNEVIE